MADVYLHLGAHKTGTKLLQKWLAENGEFLRAQDWAFIPGRRIQADVRRWRWNPTRDEIPPSLPRLLGRLASRPERSCVLSWDGMLGLMDLKRSPSIYPGARVVLEVLHDLVSLVSRLSWVPVVTAMREIFGEDRVLGAVLRGVPPRLQRG